MEVLARFQPDGVDVSSGVESAPGIKDPEKIRAFLCAARQA
jgi:phosphoribosylanthranilate isomerase